MPPTVRPNSLAIFLVDTLASLANCRRTCRSAPLHGFPSFFGAICPPDRCALPYQASLVPYSRRSLVIAEGRLALGTDKRETVHGSKDEGGDGFTGDHSSPRRPHEIVQDRGEIPVPDLGHPGLVSDHALRNPWPGLKWAGRAG